MKNTLVVLGYVGDEHPPGPLQQWMTKNDFLSTWEMKKGHWLFVWYIGNEILPSYVGIIMNHENKDPYETTRMTHGK